MIKQGSCLGTLIYLPFMFVSSFLTVLVGPYFLFNAFIKSAFFIVEIPSIPLFFASSSDISTVAAAPSFIPDAFPAVTVPSFLNTGLSLDKVSKSNPSLGCSSKLKSTSDFFDLILIFTISSLNLRPSSFKISFIIFRVCFALN